MGLGPEVLIIDFPIAGPKDSIQKIAVCTQQQNGEFEATIPAIDVTDARRNFYKGVIS